MSADTFGMLGIMFQDLLDFDFKVKVQKEKGTETVNQSIKYCTLEYVHEKVNWNTVSRLTSTWVSIQMLYHYQVENGKFPSDYKDLIQYKDKFLTKHLFDIKFISDKFCETLCRNNNVELNYICAIFGGIVGQEIIKVISRDAIPIDNYFIFDGIENYSGFIEKLK